MMKRRYLSYLKKAALSAVFLVLSLAMPTDSFALMPSPQGKEVVPDFAFPEKVEKEADGALDEALAKGDDVTALSEAVKLIAARNAVSAESFTRNVALLDSLSGVMKAPYAALASLLEAGMYCQLYNVSPWQYNNRTLPLDTYPEDPFAWSGDLFAKKVLSLVDKATSDMAPAEETPINKILPLIVNSGYAEKAGLSVADFIVARSASLLATFARGGEEAVIPFFGDKYQAPVDVRQECALRRRQLVDNLYDRRVKGDNMAEKVVAISLRADIIPYGERDSFIGEWVERLKDVPESGLLLHDWFSYIPGSPEKEMARKKQLYDLSEEYLKKFPDSDFASAIKYDLAQITSKRASVTVPSLTMSARPVEVTLSARNLNTAYVLLYSVPESIVPMHSLNVKDFPGKAHFIKAIQVEMDGMVPFSADKKIELPSLTPGYYVVIPSEQPKLSTRWKEEVDKWSISVINVSDIAVVSSMNSREADSGYVYVVDAASQRPIKGATVKFYPDNSVNKVLKTVVTDKEGKVAPPQGFLRMRVTKGNSLIWDSSDVYYQTDKETEQTNALLLTDLSIYKPGDKVQFSVVAWTSKGHDNRLLANTRLQAILLDANWNKVDTLTLTSDKFGRATGEFTLPTSGLLGHYTLQVTAPKLSVSDWDGSAIVIGSQGFQVAEYKTPSFFVALSDDAEKSYEPGDTVVFKGEVMTYSGMSLGGSEVKYSVVWQPCWKWFNGGIDNASYTGTATVDSDGKFTIELPTANLKGTPYERGLFVISATVTSPSGETQMSSNISFSLGRDFSIRPDLLSDKVKVTADSVRFNVPVYDILNHPVVKEVDYTLFNGDAKEVTSGRFTSPVLNLPVGKLPSGEYKLCFKLPGDTLSTDEKVVLWRDSDAKPPVTTPLWVPQTEFTVAEGAPTVDVKVGSSYKGSWILCIVSDESRVLERRWLAVNGENTVLTVEAPEGEAPRYVNLIGMHDHKAKTEKLKLTPEAANRKMKVTTLSFRDKISAGDRETWKFSFKVDDEAQSGLPAIAVMSNKALDALAPFNWNFSIGNRAWYDYSRLNSTNPYQRTVSAGFTRLPRLSLPDTSLPDWNTYNMLLAGASRYGGTFVRGSRSMMMRKAAATTDSAGPVEMQLSENEVFMSVESAPINMNAMAVKNEEKSMSVAEDADEGVAQAGGATNGASSKKEEPRPVDMPLAFFKPSLYGDADGNVNVEFVTPNFNTTWKFQIMGYNEAVQSAGLVLEAVASKPVMVQANPPRYLRTGDQASLSAILFNNSPDAQMLHGEIEIFNPLTGETITSKHLGEEKTAPGANRSFSIDFPVPSDLNALGMRAYAYAGDHADGEQTLIPVLPSSTPVVESTQFYLGSRQDEFSVKLPKYGEDASLTLKYCSNPVWECVLALPGISNPDSKSVLSLSRALYANGMAKGIMEKFPQVKAGLTSLFAAKDKGEEVKGLKSNLQKDSLLKTVALVNTPWVNNAASETMRLESLDALLDAQQLQDALADIASRLAKLQNPDGGWAWCEGMRSSEFITTSVLSNIAALRNYGTVPSEKDMTQKAIAYCDKSLYDDYVKNDKHFSTISMLRYLYVRSMFDAGNGKSGFAGLKKEVLKAIDKEWKEFSIFDKATAAILLNRTPEYAKTSLLILESLRQLAGKSESKGWWYDNLSGGWNGMPKLATTARALEAFAEIEPSAEAVEGLRQWLVLQKETEDWGADSYTAGIISAVLNSGADWTVPANSPSISIDGKPLDLSGSDILTGIATVQLDPKLTSGKILTVEKSGDVPAWGGVISQYIAPMKDVKADRCDNLRIEKQLLLLTEENGVETARNVNLNGKQTLKPGDKVRVTLTLTCGKDMDYVAVIDERSACLEPADQISGYRFADGLGLYREVRDTKTSFFIGYLPKGVNVISYDCYVDREGEYALGIASAQSQYSPLQSAHSAGATLKVKK